MTASPPPLRWWGWGDRDTDVPLGLAALLHDEAGVELGTRTPPSPRESVVVPRSPLADAPLLGELGEICGATAVRVDDESRLAHAGGRSYLDLLRLRGTDIGVAPDAVVLPPTRPRLPRFCAPARAAAAPWCRSAAARRWSAASAPCAAHSAWSSRSARDGSTGCLRLTRYR